MTEEVKQDQEFTEQAGKAGDSGDGASQASKDNSQESLNRQFAARAKQAEVALLKRLGFESPEAAEALIKKAREREDADKSELQKAQDLAAQREKQINDLMASQKAKSTQYDVAVKAAKLGIVDPDAAFKLLDHSKIEYDDAGNPSNTEQLLKDLLTDKPYLSGGSGGSPANPGRTRKFTKEDIERMSPSEINKNWDAIKEFLEHSA